MKPQQKPNTCVTLENQKEKKKKQFSLVMALTIRSPPPSPAPPTPHPHLRQANCSPRLHTSASGSSLHRTKRSERKYPIGPLTHTQKKHLRQNDYAVANASSQHRFRSGYNHWALHSSVGSNELTTPCLSKLISWESL